MLRTYACAFGIVLLCCACDRAQAPPGAQTQPAARQSSGRETLSAELAAAQQLLRRGMHQSAIDLLQPLAAQHPNEARVHGLLGSAYHKLRRYGPASQYLERATQLDPKLVSAHLILGFCRYYLGQADAARESFAAAMQLAPEEGHAHYGIGLIEFDADRLDEAEKRFRRAAELHAAKPGNAEFEASAHAKLGDVYIRREQFEPARDELVKATTLDPNLYNAYFRLAHVLTRLGDREGAASALQKYNQIKARLPQQEGFPE
jgi:tetratricopeptide (TPR) repeat protein